MHCNPFYHHSSVTAGEKQASYLKLEETSCVCHPGFQEGEEGEEGEAWCPGTGSSLSTGGLLRSTNKPSSCNLVVHVIKCVTCPMLPVIYSLMTCQPPVLLLFEAHRAGLLGFSKYLVMVSVKNISVSIIDSQIFHFSV